MTSLDHASIKELPINLFRRRRVGLFDPLEQDGDFKVIIPAQEAVIPACPVVQSSMAGAPASAEAPFHYLFPEVAMTRVANAIVSRTGAVLRNNMAIEETLEGSLAENFSQADLGDPVDAPTVVAASRYGNFNHAIFMCEILPLFYVASLDEQTRLAPKILYFDRRYCSPAFEAERFTLLDALGLSGATRDGWANSAVRADTVLIPTVSRRQGAFRASLITRFLTGTFAAYRPPPGAAAAGAERIYISRRHAASRVPENIDELEAAAVERGFTPVHLENLTIAEQITLMRGCRLVIAEHGAGLVNLMFCVGGTRVVELFPSAMYAKWTFRFTAYVAGVDYACAAFAVPEGWVYNRDPVYIPIDDFIRCLDSLVTD